MDTLKEQLEKEKALQKENENKEKDLKKEEPAKFGNQYIDEFQKNLAEINAKKEKRGKTARRGRA